jgi:type I restriction enzyme R subunit
VPPDEGVIVDPPPPPPPDGRPKYVVSSVPVGVASKRIQYYDKDGTLITESLTDFTKKAVTKKYATLDKFLQSWTAADRKQVIVEELLEQGVILEALQDDVGNDLDPFDLITHVVYDQPPLTRRERAERVKKRDVFTKYGPQARAVLDALLEKYATEGLGPIEDMNVLRVRPLSELGTPVQLVGHFGGKDQYERAVHELEDALYAPVA